VDPLTKRTVELMMLNGTRVEIIGNDCTTEQTLRFAGNFTAVCNRLPEVTRVVLDQHCNCKLSVVLTNGSPDWGDFSKGFASTKPDGKAIFFWVPVLERIPEECLRTDIAHELGHATFVALGEPGHKGVGYKKAEWLIIALLRA
jgi:hypothetical protein